MKTFSTILFISDENAMSAQRSRQTEIVINFIFFVFVQLAIPSSTTGDGASGSRVADVNDDKQNHHHQQQQQHLASIEDGK
jgi:hypothetical protein